MTVVRMDFTHLRVFQVRLKLTKARKEKVNGESSSGFRKVTGFHLADAWIVAEPLGYLQVHTKGASPCIYSCRLSELCR